VVAARFSNLASELTATLLSLANTALPSPPSEGDPDFSQPDHSTAGKAFRGSLPPVIERLGTRLIERYNREPNGEHGKRINCGGLSLRAFGVAFYFNSLNFSGQIVSIYI
jgi:hypothetical protein